MQSVKANRMTRPTLAVASLALGCGLAFAACSPPPAQSKAETTASPSTSSPDKILAHRIECMKVGTEAEKAEFPDGKNTVASANAGMNRPGNARGRVV